MAMHWNGSPRYAGLHFTSVFWLGQIESASTLFVEAMDYIHDPFLLWNNFLCALLHLPACLPLFLVKGRIELQLPWPCMGPLGLLFQLPGRLALPGINLSVHFLAAGTRSMCLDRSSLRQGRHPNRPEIQQDKLGRTVDTTWHSLATGHLNSQILRTPYAIAFCPCSSKLVAVTAIKHLGLNQIRYSDTKVLVFVWRCMFWAVTGWQQCQWNSCKFWSNNDPCFGMAFHESSITFTGCGIDCNLISSLFPAPVQLHAVFRRSYQSVYGSFNASLTGQSPVCSAAIHMDACCSWDIQLGSCSHTVSLGNPGALVPRGEVVN